MNRDKAKLIVEALLAKKSSDDEIIAHSEGRLTVSDLNENYRIAETALSKSRDEGTVDSWLDFYFR